MFVGIRVRGLNHHVGALLTLGSCLLYFSWGATDCTVLCYEIGRGLLGQCLPRNGYGCGILNVLFCILWTLNYDFISKYISYASKSTIDT